MKRILVGLLLLWLLLPTVLHGSQVYRASSFSAMQGSRQPDFTGQSGKRVTLLTFSVANNLLGTGSVSWEDGWLELDTLVFEFFRYHNPVGTLKTLPTIAAVADITDIRLEDTQGEVVAEGRWETVLPPSWVGSTLPQGSVDQMVFKTVRPPKHFRGETFFLSVVPSGAFITDDVVGAGLRRITIRNRAGVETLEPYPEWGPFISSGATVGNPAVLNVAVSPATPKTVPPAANVAGAQFKVTAKSVRPGNPVLFRAWQMQFEVSQGLVSALGEVQILNEAGVLIKKQTIITRGDSPRKGMVFLEEQDEGRAHGYSLKETETLSVVLSTATLAGVNVTVTSEELAAADFGGSNVQYGDLVSQTSAPVSVTVHVEEPAPPSGSGGVGGGGQGGQPIEPPEPPVIVDELPVPEIVRTTYHLFGDGLFCFIVFQTPAPSGVNRVGWSIQNDHIFEDELFWNADGTGMGFKLLTLPSGLQGRAIDDVRRLFEETPARIRLLRLHR